MGDGKEESIIFSRVVNQVAKKFRAVKFVRIGSRDCIENWPDSNVPSLLLYRNGIMIQQIIGLENCGSTKEILEWRLAKEFRGGFVTTDIEHEPGSQFSVKRIHARASKSNKCDSDCSSYNDDDEFDFGKGQ